MELITRADVIALVCNDLRARFPDSTTGGDAAAVAIQELESPLEPKMSDLEEAIRLRRELVIRPQDPIVTGYHAKLDDIRNARQCLVDPSSAPTAEMPGTEPAQPC
jgi:hypothetical protein